MKLTDQKCIYGMTAAMIGRIDVVTMSLNEYSKDFTRFEIRHFLVAQNRHTLAVSPGAMPLMVLSFDIVGRGETINLLMAYPPILSDRVWLPMILRPNFASGRKLSII